MPNVEIYLDNRMEPDDVLAIEANHIVIATGASWLADGRGLSSETALTEFGPSVQIFTPDDIMAGRLPEGPTLIYDDDHYYMASVIAELLRARQIPVTLVTPETRVSAWGEMTSEQMRIQQRLLEVGAQIITANSLTAFNGREAQIQCIYTGNQRSIEVEAVVSVTMRQPNDSLFLELQQQIDKRVDHTPDSLSRIGDCEAPSIIAGAVFSGHRYARELDSEVDPDNRIKYDRVFFEDG
jgi:dimethylamine/trimethylamine dehydrogenase